MRLRSAPVMALAVMLAACGDPAGGGLGAEGASGTTDGAGLTRCDELTPVEAAEEHYADEPVYVANEMPVEEVRAWAEGQPGFQQLWIDRDRNGWVTVGFTEGVEERQAELDERFPDDGVVAVEVPHTAEELQEIQRRVAELSFGAGSSPDVRHGVVSIDVGPMTDERLDEVAERFGDEPVCVSGTDPGDLPAEGPQQEEGDGWRLLAAEQGAGQSYRTGIATDASQYAELWEEAGLSDEAPEVDLDAEVVLWFGAVYGSGCEDLRLDDVVVDEGQGLVHAEIVLVDPPSACNDDANPFAFVVAVPRERLPRGGFALQLGADDPPAGVPEERTYVETDVSEHGAVAGPDDVRVGTPEDLGLEDGQQPLSDGDFLEPGFPMPYQLYVHCGATWLGEFNDTMWRTDEVADEPNNVPPAWAEVAEQETVDLEIELATDPEPTITAEANGHAVVYEPTTEERPGCD